MSIPNTLKRKPILIHIGLQVAGTSATIVDDFNLVTTTPVTVRAGNTATIEFSIVSDTIAESTEAFTVTVTAITTENIGTLNTVTVTIEDDDCKIVFPNITIVDFVCLRVQLIERA